VNEFVEAVQVMSIDEFLGRKIQGSGPAKSLFQGLGKLFKFGGLFLGRPFQCAYLCMGNYFSAADRRDLLSLPSAGANFESVRPTRSPTLSA
jgi:hypothetical protein